MGHYVVVRVETMEAYRERIASEERERVTKLTANISQEASDAVRRLCAETGRSVTEVIRDAITVAREIDEIGGE